MTRARSYAVAHDMVQRWECQRCGRTGALTITHQQAQDGAGILGRLERDHRATSPFCIARVDRQRDAGDHKVMAGDLLVLDKRDHQAWVYPTGKSRVI